MFSELSLDLILCILKRAAIRDILSVRVTCRALHNATNERSLWIEIVANLSQEYGVVEGTYDLPAMTTRDLEAAVFRSLLFTERIAAASRNKHHVTASKTIRFTHALMKEYIPKGLFSLCGKARIWRGFDSCFLLPGGRFLVTSYQQKLITVWDLNQFFGDIKVKPRALASLLLAEITDPNFDYWVFNLLEASIGSDKRTLRVVVHAYFEYEAERFTDPEIRLYEMDLTKHQSALCLTSKRHLYARATALDGDRLVVAGWKMPQEKDMILIWDLNLDSSIAWMQEIESKLVRVAITGDYIVAVDNCVTTGFKVYDIPDVSFFSPKSHIETPITGITCQRLKLHPSNSTMTLPDTAFASGRIQLSSPPRTRHGSEPVLAFVRNWLRFADGPNRLSCTQTFSVDPLTEDGTAPQLRFLPSLSITHVDSDLFGRRMPKGYFFHGLQAYGTVWSEDLGSSNAVKMRLWRKPPEVKESLFDWLETRSTGLAEEEEVRLAEFNDFGAHGTQFCPLSTRLVLWGYHGEARILQY